MASFLNKNVTSKGNKSFIGKSRYVTTPDHLTTFNAGYIVPIFIKKTEANSSYKLDLGAMVKMPTLLNEFYGKAYIDIYAFYCSDDLLMEKYEDYIGEGHDNAFSEHYFGKSGKLPNTDSGGDIKADLFRPRLIHHASGAVGDVDNIIHVTPHSLYNYLGLPIGDFNLDVVFIDASPYRMYNLIRNTYFRAGFLQDPVLTDYGETDSEADNYVLLKACKLPDYFTGYQTPNPQLFDDITIGLVGDAPVVADSRYARVSMLEGNVDDPENKAPNENDDKLYPYKHFKAGTETGTLDVWDEFVRGAGVGAKYIHENHLGPEANNSHDWRGATEGFKESITDKVYKYYADVAGINPRARLDGATEVSLNAVRQAFVLQHISEKSLMGTDLKSFARWAWGENLKDIHLDKPLFIGGKRIPLQVNSISQTSASLTIDEKNEDLTTPLGYEAGQSKTGIVSKNEIYCNSFMTGWIMVVAVVRQENVYEYGVDRNLTIKDRFSEYWREFIHAGNQKTFNYEIYADTMTEQVAKRLYETFGFAPYAEHIRRDLNRISGYFSSKVNGSLNTYHLGSIFNSAPYLGSEFIESDAEEVFNRLIAIESEKAHQFEGYFYFKFEKVIPVPYNADPGLLKL